MRCEIQGRREDALEERTQPRNLNDNHGRERSGSQEVDHDPRGGGRG